MTLKEGQDYTLRTAKAKDLSWGTNVVITFSDGTRKAGRITTKHRGWDAWVKFEDGGTYGLADWQNDGSVTNVEVVDLVVGEMKF